MRQRILNGLILLSAVVCVGSLVWVGRSMVRWDELSGPFGTKRIVSVGSFSGQVLLLVTDAGTLPVKAPSKYYATNLAPIRPILPSLKEDMSGLPALGMGWEVLPGYFALVLPLWVVPLLSAIPPVLWWRRRRVPRRGFEVLPPVQRGQEHTAPGRAAPG